ncbi:recombinase family protein [Streptomyces sp. NPDC057702]|uniref:recombinase family protein n=1 Tax=unclassified Streptomyces TaxID=2593676 RepID=UPI0036A44170
MHLSSPVHDRIPAPRPTLGAVGTHTKDTSGRAHAKDTGGRGGKPRIWGRPPYGYRAVAGPEGTGLRLVPDERTAPVVRRIFDEYLDDRGLQVIAEGLTADEVPSPGSHGPRTGEGAAWSKSAVRAILVNPRYAGHPSANGHDQGAALCTPVLSSEVFDRVRERFEARRTRPERAAPATAARAYALRGMVRCARCNRLMQGTWNNAEPYYRCRFPAEYATANQIEHPRNVYLREQSVLGPLTSWLRSAAAPQWRLPAPRATEGHVRLEAFRALGVRMVYDDATRLLRVKAAAGPDGAVLRGALAL